MNKKRAITLTLVILFLSTISLAGMAKVLAVPEDYSNIQAAIDIAEKGDTVLLSAGNYEEDITIKDKENLTIASRDLQEFTVIKGQITISDCVNITLRNFTVTGPGYGIAVRGATVGLTFDELGVLQNTLDGFNFTGKDTRYYHVKISNSRIASNGGDGITLRAFGNDINIRKNRIVDNGTFTPAGGGGAAGDVEPKGAGAVGIRVKLTWTQSEEAAGGAGMVRPEVLKKYIIQDNIQINVKGEGAEREVSDETTEQEGEPAGGAGEAGEAAGEQVVLRVIIEDNILRGNAFAATHT